MKSPSLCFLALMSSATLANAQSPAADSVARLDSAWARSYAVHDTALAQALFAPDLVVVGGNGPGSRCTTSAPTTPGFAATPAPA